MDSSFDLYAMLYLDADMDAAALAQAVAGIAGGLAAGATVVTEWAEMFVLAGEEAATAEGFGGAQYRYCLEIEPMEHVDALSFRVKIAGLLEELREAGFRAALPRGFADEPAEREAASADDDGKTRQW